jgi:hypothetical protein
MKIIDNPFFVLGVAPEASRIEVEREAVKLLGMLELEFADARTYATPLGPRPRTTEMVRDPYQRLVAELWARHAPPARLEPPARPEAAGRGRAGVRRALGWKP